MRPVLLLMMSLSLLACTDVAPRDASGPGAGGAGAGGTGSGATHAGGTGGVPCIDGFADSAQEATYDSANNFSNVIANTMGADFDSLALQLFYDLGADATPHTFVFSGENYADCHTCLVLYQACDATDQCVAVFIVDEGTLDVTANDTVADESFIATLSNARLLEATIDGSTFQSTLVPNGLTWCIDSFTFDATITLTP